MHRSLASFRSFSTACWLGAIGAASIGCSAGGSWDDQPGSPGLGGASDASDEGDWGSDDDGSEVPPVEDEECLPGLQDCPCTFTGECDTDLTCEVGVCVPDSDSCGDGVVNEGEECDDGNDDDHDGCLSTCALPTCGDGFVHEGEECDDGNENGQDGCDGSCECRLSFEDPAVIEQWEVTGDWGLYDRAPQSTTVDEVVFETQGQVLGTDGNRAAPYPGSEQEESSALSPTFTVPPVLRFRSWHIDEGTVRDAKYIMISVDDGATWEPLASCIFGPHEDLPFCQARMGTRAEDDWDDIEIDMVGYVGEQARLQFHYLNTDVCCGGEQGWFIDDLNVLGC